MAMPKAETYIDTLCTMTGCDSIRTLELTVFSCIPRYDHHAYLSGGKVIWAMTVQVPTRTTSLQQPVATVHVFLELTVIPEVELTDTLITGDNGNGNG